LVSERIELAKIRKKVKKSRPQQDIEKVKREVIQEFIPNGPKCFPEHFINPSVTKENMKEVLLPNEPLRPGHYFFGDKNLLQILVLLIKQRALLRQNTLFIPRNQELKRF